PEDEGVGAVVDLFSHWYGGGPDRDVAASKLDVPIRISVTRMDRQPRANVKVALDRVQVSPVVDCSERQEVGYDGRQNSLAPRGHFRTQQRLAQQVPAVDAEVVN